MDVRILDLDEAVTAQRELARHVPHYAATDWGPAVRLACSFGRFRQFERAVSARLGGARDTKPWLTFCGSGDFHHVSLALLRRLEGPCNLLVLDTHPDWMVGVPFLHCGTWLYHAARLPQVRRIFHVGGDVDFDNRFAWLAPWNLLRSGKITVQPAVRRFHGARWRAVEHQPLRATPPDALTFDRMEELLRPYRDELGSCPLYVSLDKDVMRSAEAVVNWDSGWLERGEVCTILHAFGRAAGGLAGMDIVGDWSPVQVRGLFRRWWHWTEHPRLAIVPAVATRTNEETNFALLAAVEAAFGAVMDSSGAVSGTVRHSAEG